jgi:pilus assembly protein CpaF
MSIDAAVHRAVVGHDATTLPVAARTLAAELDPFIAPARLRAVVDRVVARVQGFGGLDPLLADPSVSEVMVNGGSEVWVERAGVLERSSITLDVDETFHIIERIAAPLGRRVDRSSPILDARLADGSRVHAIVPPLAIDGPSLTIRRFSARTIDLRSFAPTPIAGFLRAAVCARRNVVVSGATSSGKTTLLNALAAEIPRHERIVTIEDAAELRLPGDHVVRLEARPPSLDGAGAVTIRDLVRAALRMRPDRIVVGECRGGETLDMVQAMNTGHEGSMSTCHANSPADAVARLELMVLMSDVALTTDVLRRQLAASLDLIVHVERTGTAARRITSIVEMLPDGSTREVAP